MFIALLVSNTTNEQLLTFTFGEKLKLKGKQNFASRITTIINENDSNHFFFMRETSLSSV